MSSNTGPCDLRTDYATQPLGVHQPPVLAWRYPSGPTQQTAYRIVIDTQRTAARDRKGQHWDTGWRTSASQRCRYDGGDLAPGTRYWWSVGIKSMTGEESWSEPTWFETGIDEWTGCWIRPPDSAAEPAPTFRRTFEVAGDVERARLYLAAGGLYDARINESEVDDRVLDTAVTDYTERVLYAIHDVTDQVRTGHNELSVTAGRGRYALTTPNTWGWHEAPWHQPRPELRGQLEMTFGDGRERIIGTDEAWRVQDSPTRFDSIYEGEVYHVREAGREAGEPARLTDGPSGELHPQTMPPMTVRGEIRPQSIAEIGPGRYVIDFGRVLAGRVALRCDGAAGQNVTLRYGEQLADDGTVDRNQPHIEGAFQTDRLRLDGGGIDAWRPRFSYKGFRYVEVDGLANPPTRDSVVAEGIHSAVDTDDTSRFVCGSELLTRIHANSRRTMLNNFHGIPTDTPAYEKNGWTGDVVAAAPAICDHLQPTRFLRKWVQDIADSQRSNGEVPPIAPTSGFGYSEARFGESITSPNPAWDAAFVTVPWTLYRHTGEIDVLRDHVQGMEQLVAYFSQHAENGILDAGLGDWLAPGHGEIRARPPERTGITGTAFYYRMVDLLGRIARILGLESTRRRMDEQKETIATAFNQQFLAADEGVYRTGEADEYRQTSNVLPLAFGLVPDDLTGRVLDRLVTDILETHDGHLNTGFHGTAHLLPVLTTGGYPDVAYTVATRESYPSWGHWITARDATTHWEMWELDARSRDHFAFGSIDRWFYEHLGGIRPEAPGFETVRIDPSFPRGLGWVSATVETVRGPIQSQWSRQPGGRINLTLTLPGNTPARVVLPTDATTQHLEGPGERHQQTTEASPHTTAVGGGHHRFSIAPGTD